MLRLSHNSRKDKYDIVSMTGVWKPTYLEEHKKSRNEFNTEEDHYKRVERGKFISGVSVKVT